MRLDAARPACFRQATTRRGIRDEGDQQHDRHLTARRPPPGAEAPAGGPALDLRCPPNAAGSRRPDVCAVTRTTAWSCPGTPPAASATGGAQPNCATSEVITPCAKP